MSYRKTISVKKGEIIQRQGDLCDKVFEVKSGLLRSYSIDEKGKEHIFMFSPEGSLMTDHLPPHLPADLYIDAIEASEVQIGEKNLAVAMRDIHQVVRTIDSLQKRVIMLMSSSIIERYKHFVETYPQIVERVPQKMIASYLGVTPEALSKAKGHFLQAK